MALSTGVHVSSWVVEAETHEDCSAGGGGMWRLRQVYKRGFKRLETSTCAGSGSHQAAEGDPMICSLE